MTASTAKGEFGPDALTDERTKSFWLAEANDERQWVLIDLEKPARVCAVQVNYHDYRSNLYGRIPGLRHRYVIEGSSDGGRPGIYWSIAGAAIRIRRMTM